MPCALASGIAASRLSPVTELYLVHLQACLDVLTTSTEHLNSDNLAVEALLTYRLQIQVSQLRQNAHRKSNSPFARSIESTLRLEAIDGSCPWGSRMYRNLLRRLWLRLASLRPVI